MRLARLFRHENRERTAETRRVWAMYEVAYTLVDFTAAVAFLLGSVLFFWRSLETAAIWLFVIGSACFLMKPTIRLARELRLLRMRDYDDLAQRLED